MRDIQKRTKDLLDFALEAAEKAAGRQLVKVDEAAKMLDCTERTIQRMARRGEIGRYNEDGTIKNNSRRTQVYYDVKELAKQASHTIQN